VELIKEEKWNNLETAVWEKHYIDEYSMKAQQAGFETDNVAEPLTKETFDDLKRKGLFNGC